MNDYNPVNKLDAAVVGADVLELLNQYRSLLVINQEDLPTAYAEQPSLALMVRDLLTDLTARRDRVKREAEVSRAQTYAACRLHRQQVGEKPTEAILTADVDSNPEYNEIRAKLIVFTEAVGYAHSLVEAYNQRSYMLKHLGEYFAPARMYNEAGYENNRATLAEARK